MNERDYPGNALRLKKRVRSEVENDRSSKACERMEEKKIEFKNRGNTIDSPIFRKKGKAKSNYERRNSRKSIFNNTKNIWC